MKQRLCAEDLEKAEPALIAAQAALDILDKVHNIYYILDNNTRISETME